ncbi:MAG TPA: flippase [Ktedonobacterales bacterium]|nr:flippase [Ktedonobacterales bacterium]
MTPEAEDRAGGMAIAVRDRPDPVSTAVADPVSQKEVVVSTAGGAAIAGVGNLLSGVLRYAATIAMTHMVTQGAYGVFVVALSTVTFISFLPKLGLDTVMLRFLPGYRAGGKHTLAAGLLRFAVATPTMLGILCAIVFYLISSMLANSVYHHAIYDIPFKEAALLIPLIAVQGMLISALRALKAIKWQMYVDKVIDPGCTLIFLIVFYVFGLRLEALILANIVGVAISIAVGWVWLRRATKHRIQTSIPEYDANTWLRFGTTMIFSVMAFTTIQSTDVLFLGGFATPGQVALYGVANRISYLVAMPLLALNIIFSPMISEFYARGEHSQLESMFALVTRWAFSLAWPVFLCCLIFHDAILGLFGKEYRNATAALVILAFGSLVSAGTGSVYQILTMTGRQRVIWCNMAGILVVNLILVLALTPRFNVIGAAVAATLTVILLNVVAFVEVWWTMKLQPYRWTLMKPLLAGAVASAVGLLIRPLIHVGYGKLAIVGAMGLVLPFVIVYFAVLALMRLGIEDLMVLEAVSAKLGTERAVSAARRQLKQVDRVVWALKRAGRAGLAALQARMARVEPVPGASGAHTSTRAATPTVRVADGAHALHAASPARPPHGGHGARQRHAPHGSRRSGRRRRHKRRGNKRRTS